MKRSINANAALYVALFCMYIESFLNLQPAIKKELQERLANAAVVTENFKRKEEDVIRQNHYDLMTVLDKKNFFKKKLKFDEFIDWKISLSTSSIL